MRQQDLELLLNANRVLASTLEIDRLLKVVLELAAEVVQAETGSLLILDERTNELVFDVALGEAGKELKTIRLKLGEGIAGWVAQENKPLIVNDPANDPRWTRRGDQKTKFVTRSILCVPMVHQGKLLGVVQAINRKDQNGFSNEDRVVLEAFAAQTAVAVQNARLFSSLRQEKEKVEIILSQMVEGAAYSDERGQLVLANPAARQLLGIPEGEIFSYNLWAVLQQGFALNPAYEALSRSDAPVLNFEATRSEGKTLVLSGMTKKIFSDKKECIGQLTVLRDITAEKKEEKLKRDFLSLMSHKLKTPLVAITGYTPMLLEDEDLSKNPFYKKALQAINSQGLHLKQLVEKLISFSLIEGEDLRLDKRANDAKKIVSEAVMALRPVLEDWKAVVQLDPSLDALPQVVVDFEKFREILKGLIENAAKFNSKAQRSVMIFAQKVGDQVTISVKDDGRGIPAEEFEKIFQKFYQIEESFTGQVEGAGLGLALVKRLVEAHGGSVHVESKIGEGSIFSVTIPAAG
jgi:PAS domain S-box-containing protein